MTTRNPTSILPRRRQEGEAAPSRLRLSPFLWFLIQWPWLLKSLSGGSENAKRELLRDLELCADALPHLGSWKADTGYLSLIVEQVASLRPAVTVELGAGASTLVAARAMQMHGGGRLTSCDQHGDFVAATRDWLDDFGVEADLRTTPLSKPPNDWPGRWYRLDSLPERIDLLLIDGPPWTLHPMVRGAAESLFDRIPVGGVVLLDDGARPGERRVARRWRRRWPNFQFDLVQRGTKGTLIGKRLR